MFACSRNKPGRVPLLALDSHEHKALRAFARGEWAGQLRTFRFLRLERAELDANSRTQELVVTAEADGSEIARTVSSDQNRAAQQQRVTNRRASASATTSLTSWLTN